MASTSGAEFLPSHKTLETKPTKRQRKDKPTSLKPAGLYLRRRIFAVAQDFSRQEQRSATKKDQPASLKPAGLNRRRRIFAVAQDVRRRGTGAC
jgi:hypothetical protein